MSAFVVGLVAGSQFMAALVSRLWAARFGFVAIALASMIVPLASLVLIVPLRALGPSGAERAPLSSVLGAVLLPGLGFALSGITFGSVTAFLTLYFAVRGWTDGALAFTAFAVALIVTRIVAGHLPDRFGGARVALYCLGCRQSASR